jgi:uncharacterized protein
MAYLDTSILGSYYCQETLSAAVSRELPSLSLAIISPLVEVEFTSLLSLKCRTGDLGRAAADQTRRRFQKHKAQQLYRLVPLGDREFATAARFLANFNTSLRTLDALHLAVAATHKQELWTTDKLLAASARAFGIRCKHITL